jgi:hypothetical protein
VSLRPLSEYQPEPYRPRWAAIGALVAVAVAFAATMPLGWVGVVTPLGRYVHVSGIEMANWMLLAAVVIVVVAVRLVREPAGGYLRFVLLLLDVFVPLGMYIEYIDNLSRASIDVLPPYLGPGYFIALSATGVLIVTSVFAWRDRS